MQTITKLIRKKAQALQEPNNSPVYLTSSFTFKNANEAYQVFSDQVYSDCYSRFTNPNVRCFEEQLAILEGGENAVAFSSGMASLTAFFLSQLKPGDHIVASYDLFGSTIGLITGLLKKFGIESTFVSVDDIKAWEKAIQKNTKVFIAESPTNPTLKILDIQLWVKLAKSYSITTLLDNCILSPALQTPMEFGVDVVMHSSTKSIDGQGRVLGGIIVGSNELCNSLFQFLRTTGSTLSAFNAWTLSKSLETLDLRMHKHSENAAIVADFLADHPKISQLYYPGLKTHPNHHLAKKQMKGFGGIISFEIKNNSNSMQENAWKIIDNSGFFSITGNFGDTKTTIIHPATTTHFRIGEEGRKNAGIKENLIRLSVGLESATDIINQLDEALSFIE